MNPIDIGNKLRNLRGERSRETVANAIGVGVSAIAMYEIGDRIPRDAIKIRLANYYGVSVQELFFDNNDTEGD